MDGIPEVNMIEAVVPCTATCGTCGHVQHCATGAELAAWMGHHEHDGHAEGGCCMELVPDRPAAAGQTRAYA